MAIKTSVGGNLFCKISVFLISAAIGTCAAADLVYFEENGGNGNQRGFYNFDSDSGTSTLRSTVAAGPRFFSMAVQPASGGAIFGMDPSASTLYSLDIDTGSFTLLAATGLDTIADISFDPNNGTLYGLGRNTRNLYTINFDGTSNLIGTTSNVRTALAFAPDGNLYGLDLTGNLYQIDPNTGVDSLIGGGTVTGLPEDASFGKGGAMFITNFEGDLFKIDTSTGTGVQLGSSGMGNGLLGVVAIPEPSSALLCLVCVFGLQRRRVRSR